MKDRISFYKDVVHNLIKDRSASILICGAGSLDRTVFLSLGFTDVTISNLDTRIGPNVYEPFKWKFENAEALTFEDSSFDYVVIHAAIHHASLPHKVLTEMYRVSKKGLLAFESRDSFTMRILEKFNLTQIYEHAAVYYNDCAFGGRNNTDIPNFVYRWTEREIEKTIQTYSPFFQHKYVYKYGTSFPCTPELESKGKAKIALLKLIRPVYEVFIKVFPKQQNLFAFYVEKPTDNSEIFSWLQLDKAGKIRFNKQWGDEKYGKGTLSDNAARTTPPTN